MNILVAGANGQLGQCFKEIIDRNGNGEANHFVGEKNYWTFVTHKDLDITDRESVISYIREHSISVVVNCAAYTNVEEAENNFEIAERINSEGVENLAIACSKVGAILIHFSTDYVFDGKGDYAYTPEKTCNPLNAYGKTKRDGELKIIESGSKYLIFRVSWLYSIYGKNFVKTMTNKIRNNENVRVVSDQYGTPTNAHELAKFIYSIIENDNSENRNLLKTGIYHFSDVGVISWFDLVCKIKEIISSQSEVTPCLTKEWASKTERPLYSPLNSDLTDSTFNVKRNSWKDNVRDVVLKLI